MGIDRISKEISRTRKKRRKIKIGFRGSKSLSKGGGCNIVSWVQCQKRLEQNSWVQNQESLEGN